MTALKIYNPFNAFVFHEETVSSTMDVSRQLEAKREPHGTVIAADFQEAGRGRISGREWQMDRKKNLAFSILLRYQGIENIPRALTLRAGLAVSLAIEDFIRETSPQSASLPENRVLVKWPNDIMIGSRKTAGILCEASGGNVFLGIGINVLQKEFPAHLREKAASIAIAAGNEHLTQNACILLLEKTLACLYSELETSSGEDWKNRLEKRLYKKGGQVTFFEGEADSGKEVKGCLIGIGDSGELIISLGNESRPRFFNTGELRTY